MRSSPPFEPKGFANDRFGPEGFNAKFCSAQSNALPRRSPNRRCSSLCRWTAMCAVPPAQGSLHCERELELHSRRPLS